MGRQDGVSYVAHGKASVELAEVQTQEVEAKLSLVMQQITVVRHSV